MPINMTVRMRDVWRRVGIRKLESPHTFTDPEWRLQRVKSQQLGVCFAWENRWSFLLLRAFHAAPGQQEREFRRGGHALMEAYQTVSNAGMRVPPDFLAQNEVLTGVVAATARMRILFCVDTDHEAFRLACNARQANGLVVRIRTQVFDTVVAEQGEIELHLEPADLPTVYQGYLALDLGNTSSTLAAHPGELLDHGRVWIIDGEAVCGCSDAKEELTPANHSSSANSAVRVDAVNAVWLASNPGLRDHPSCFDWSIGERALAERSSDGVVLGAKRLLAGRDYNDQSDIRVHTRPDYESTAPREPMPMPNRLPGELLMCRLLQRFRETISRQLPALAVTYPTSYSRREIEQLREVTSRAIARQNAWDQSPGRLDEAKGLIKGMLDEASASAFFFLFRDVLKSPPGLSRFRYLYPQGYNLLLYDCGGGTTDIGLVKATADPANDGFLRVEVRGRSGVRGFGGDNITVAVFRLLKAFMAVKVQEARGTQVTIKLSPNNAQALAKELDTHAKLIDREVPTTYNRKQPNNDDRRNRDHTRHLWQRALEVKHKLEGGVATGSAQPFSDKDTFDDPLCQYLFENVRDKQQSLREKLRTIKIRREDVDVLVRPGIETTVRRCNKLIDRCLITGVPEFPEPVHRFVMLGNGSRYPLVKQLLSEQLDVLFFDDDLLVFEPDNLKNAVAKGAVLALVTAEAAPDVRLVFDWTMSDRLPYDVGYHRLKKGGQVYLLYREGQRYEEIQAGPAMQIQVLAAEGQKPTMLQLVRRWPGDEVYEEYLTFKFPYGIESPVTIEYDETQEFRVVDGNNSPGVLVDAGTEDLYLHPVERGTL